MIVAIDGPAGAGKTTIAERLAKRLGWLRIDTGAMYRAVALKALRHHVPLDDPDQLAQLARSCQIEFEPSSGRVLLDGEDVTEAIRQADVSQAASTVASHEAVRKVLVEKQRELAAGRNVIMEGRDIGTVVFPNADLKIFLDASAEVRARRRLHDLKPHHPQLSLREVFEQLRQRDERDRNRAVAPLRPAPDAIRLDTTNLTIEQVEELILKLIQERAHQLRGAAQ